VATEEEVKRRVEVLRADYQLEVGYAFEHFYCPILHVDQATELLRGHVINEKLGYNLWVPQRRDLDSFYGTAAEADFIAAVQDHSKTALEKWLDPKMNRRHKPRLMLKGEEVQHYFTEKPANVPAGHTSVKMVGPAGETLCNFAIKKSQEDLKSLQAETCQIVVNQDYRPAVIASVLKAAHLTMFHLLKYRHVFSPAGLYLASILREYFLEHGKDKKKKNKSALAAHFKPYASMISPMILKNKEALRGTAIDNRMIVCIGATEGIFASGVIVPAGGAEAFCVFLPKGEGNTIDTYVGFLKEPPASFQARFMQFSPADDRNEAKWLTPNTEAIRIELPDRLP
jgi:hypothetical protein